MDMNKKKTLIGIICAAVAVILVLALILIESSLSGRLIIKNNTDKNIDNLLIHFYDEIQQMEVDYLYECDVKAGAKDVFKYEGYYDFTGLSCLFCADVTFEGEEEIQLYDGDFKAPFKGNFYVTFYQEDGNYCVALKASEGLFRSVKATGLDSKMVLLFDDSDWDYIG